jgi:hypothetical protein
MNPSRFINGIYKHYTLPLYKHRHDDVDITIRADGFDDARTGGRSYFQSYLGLFEYTKSFRQVFAVYKR